MELDLEALEVLPQEMRLTGGEGPGCECIWDTHGFCYLSIEYVRMCP